MAEEQELLEPDHLAEEQRIADLRHQQDMEQQRTDAPSHEQSARNWADYVEAGARQIALEAVGHARVRDTFLLPARQVGFPLRSRSFGGPRRHGKGQRA